MYYDIGVMENCKNPDSFGEICVKCNKCGRFDRETQVEKMARTLCGKKEKRCQDCDSYNLCEFWIEASTLHYNGYRKQSEGEWIAKSIMVRSPFARNYYCSVCKYEPVETKSYCPECGAKMKGGVQE